MFDLPNTRRLRAGLAKFLKDLLEDGFTMMQYSVYIRHCAIVENAKVNAPAWAVRVPSQERCDSSRSPTSSSAA